MAIVLPPPSEAAIDDTVAATGLDRGAAAQRARMQDIATAARTELREVDRGYLMLRVDDEDDGLLYLTTEPGPACERLTEILGGGADGIAVLPAERSSVEMEELLAAVQGELAGAPEGSIGMVRVDSEEGLVLVQVPVGAGEEVDVLLEGLPDDVEELVVVEETPADRLPIEGG